MCYPSEGRFLRGEHYIDAEFLSEDGNFHYENILAYYQRHIRSGRPGICIPLEEKPTIEEQIAKIEKTIDLKRK
ncbi:MAG: hypothetical protein NZM25_08830 [Leptospiraceae bacterium]|nr:hypothetical protein [Leptospiraceae bacterium]MDW8306822.1 hypothetical protein [Leptospiraceae bacterium]